MTIYSTQDELKKIAHFLTAYMRIPFFQDDSIPGKIMEKIISTVRGADQLPTYDYVDVVIKGNTKAKGIGWSVKSTKEATPLTWKRAKIENKNVLIKASEDADPIKSADGLNALGVAIIDFCNAHAEESIKNYHLSEIGYARLIMFDDNTAIYFERLLCTENNPKIFQASEYTWKWSTPKDVTKKEQLPALHGTNRITGKKAFAWHGKGENQLHFSGEDEWWPTIAKPEKVGEINFSQDGHAISFRLPTEKVEWESLVEFLKPA